MCCRITDTFPVQGRQIDARSKGTLLLLARKSTAPDLLEKRKTGLT